MTADKIVEFAGKNVFYISNWVRKVTVIHKQRMTNHIAFQRNQSVRKDHKKAIIITLCSTKKIKTRDLEGIRQLLLL